MSDQLTPYGEASNLPMIKQLETFQMLLNKDLDRSQVKKTPDGKAEELPIGVVENTLDEVYNGLWKTTGFRYQVIVNELTAQITLHVFHPIAKVWLSREGAAAKAVQMVSLTQDEKEQMTKQQRNLYAQSLENKVSNCIEKQLPSVKALAIKNAAKSLGVTFGRNLNRKDLDDYEYSTISEQAEGMEALVMEALALIESSNLNEDRKVNARKKVNKTSYKGLPRLIEYLKTVQS